MRSRRPALSLQLICTMLCLALLVSPSASAIQGNVQRGTQGVRGERPTKGAPGQNLPNLDDVRRRGPSSPKAMTPVPSRRKKYRHEGRNGLDQGVARDTRAEADAEPASVVADTTAAPSRAYSILGALAGGLNNPYSGVLLASTAWGIPEPPPTSRGASRDTSPSSSSGPAASTGWFSSLSSFFGMSAPARRMPQGVFENADCYYVWGWAWDNAQPNKPIIVTLYDGAQPVASFLADQYRADIGTSDDKRHGFRFPLPDSLRNSSAHTLSVQVQGTGSQGILSSSPRTVSSCAVNYDGAISSADCDRITGWAWDVNRPSTPIDVDIYVDGAFHARESADTYDATLGKGDNRHRFSLPTPVAARDGQAHAITIRPSGSSQTQPLATASTGACNGPTYQGYVGWATCDYIWGWVWDSQRPNTPVNVDLLGQPVRHDRRGRHLRPGPRERRHWRRPSLVSDRHRRLFAQRIAALADRKRQRRRPARLG